MANAKRARAKHQSMPFVRGSKLNDEFIIVPERSEFYVETGMLPEGNVDFEEFKAILKDTKLLVKTIQTISHHPDVSYWLVRCCHLAWQCTHRSQQLLIQSQVKFSWEEFISYYDNEGMQI